MKRIAATLLLLAGIAIAQSSPVNSMGAATDTGVRPYTPYIGARENINLINGNVNINVPLLHLPGRNGLDLDLALQYDSKIWKFESAYEAETDSAGGYWMIDDRWPNVSWTGWRLNLPSLTFNSQWHDTGPYGPVCYGAAIVTLPDGDKHSFTNDLGCPTIPPGFTVVDADDGSGMRFDASNPSDLMVITRKGMRYHFTGEGAASKIEDANGNYISIQTATNSPEQVTSVTDTVGRVITFSYGATGDSTALNGITYQDHDNINVPIQLQWASFPFNYYFYQPHPTGSHSHPYLIVHNRSGIGSQNNLFSVTIPGGQQFRFDYNAFLELSKVYYPSGGYTTYDFPLDSTVDFHDELNGPDFIVWSDFREIRKKRACRKSSAGCSPLEEDVTTFHPTIDGYKANNQYMDVVEYLTAEEGYLSHHEFTQGLVPDYPLDGTAPAIYPSVPHEINLYAYAGKDSSSSLLRLVQTAYSDTAAWGLPTQVTTTLYDIAPPISKTESFVYDIFTAIVPPIPNAADPYPAPVETMRSIDNVLTHIEYGYDAGVLRRTENTWLKTNTGVNNLNYFDTSIRLLSLKAETKVFNTASGGTALSDTKYEYDNYSAPYSLLVTNASGVFQHEAPLQPSARGNLTKISQWRNTDGGWLDSHMQYDDSGHTRFQFDPMLHSTEYQYSDNFPQTCSLASASFAYRTKVINALSQATNLAYDRCDGTTTSVTDPNQQTTSYGYDSNSHLTSISFPDNGQITYDYNFSVPFTFGSRQKQDTNPDNDIKNTTIYDGLARVAQKQLTSDPDGTVYQDFGYDALGRTLTVSNPYRNVNESTYGVTTTNYDGLSRVTKVIPPDGSSSANNVSTTYSGNCTTVTDQAGKQRKSCVDGLGRLTGVWEDPAGWNYETDYSYDALDNLTYVNQKGDNTAPRTRSFTYDSLSRLLSANNPESATITYVYDSDGLVSQKTDARGVTSLNYDALHRILGKGYSDGTTPSLWFGYDQSSVWGLSPENPIGRLTSSSSSASDAWTAFSYDPMGRVKAKWSWTPSFFGAPLIAHYDLAGRADYWVYPSGRKVTYAHSGAGRLTNVNFDSFNGQNVNYPYWSVPTGSGNDPNTWGYHPNGSIRTANFGNGVSEVTEQNQRLQPTDELVYRPAPMRDSYTDKWQSHTINWLDAAGKNNGNVWNTYDNLNSVYTQDFDYDALNRITSGSRRDGAFSQTFSIDPWGNLTQFGTLTFNPGFDSKNRIANSTAPPDNCTHSPTIRCYDAAGNLVWDESHSYEYDAENRIKSVDAGAGATYTYDADGQRVRKDVGSSATEYVYFGGQVIAEMNPATGDWSDYVYADSKRVARADTYNDELAINGTRCGNCGWQWAQLVFNNSPAVGYTIRSGDRLFLRQWQAAGSRGGVVLAFSDWSSTTWLAYDQDGQVLNQDGFQAVQHWRRIDLSQFASKTIGQAVVGADGGTDPGNWFIVFADIVIVSADGSVHTIYGHENTASLALGSITSGMTGVGYTVSHWSGRGSIPELTTTYYHSDHLGSARLLTNYSGVPWSQATYLPFGSEYNSQTTVNHYKFTGKERDTETGLDYFRARYYGSNMGRFTSPDPLMIMKQKLVDPQQWNMYSYARNNPLRFVDPTGMYVCKDSKNCSSEKDKAFQARLAALKAARDNLKEGSRQYKRIDAILKNYGAVNQTGTGAEGKTVAIDFSLKGGGGITTQTSKDTITVNFNSDFARLSQSNAVGMTVLVGHEGQHVVDGAPKGQGRLPSEIRAESVSQDVAEGMGQTNFTVRGIELWNSEKMNNGSIEGMLLRENQSVLVGLKDYEEDVKNEPK